MIPPIEELCRLPFFPCQPFLPNCRRLVLPVHLLGRDSIGWGCSSRAALLCCVGAVAGDVEFQDDGVVHRPVDGRGGGHGVGEDELGGQEVLHQAAGRGEEDGAAGF